MQIIIKKRKRIDYFTKKLKITIDKMEIADYNTDINKQENKIK